jgi:1,4-dihydroxy-2-naphthoate octaprenyltransferase
VLLGGGLFLVLACLASLPLIAARGWVIVAIGLPSLSLSYGYTGGPFPLATSCGWKFL